ncbi:hypothetical protein BDV18DRAFT_147997 [Aspergillus unguis]
MGPEYEYPEPPSQSQRSHLASNSHAPSYAHHAHSHYPGQQPGLGAYPSPGSGGSSVLTAASVAVGGPASNYRRDSPEVGDPNDPSADKRPRACESCRGLKVRCEPDPNPDEPCKRCAKAGRQCVVTAPNRKRQKKTDSRVTELERKIDVLTATLHATQKVEAVLPSNNAAQAASASTAASMREENSGLGRRWLVPGQSSDRSSSIPPRAGPSGSGSKRHYSGDIKSSQSQARNIARTISTPSLGSNASPGTENTDSSGRQLPAVRASWSNNTRRPSLGAKEVPSPPDIIERGLVSLAVASDAFTRFVESMCHYIPMVVFPPGTQMSEVRKHRPVLFHAIVAVSVGPFEPNIQSTLLIEFYRTVGERVIVKGEKSLDLVQGLLVSCAFYIPPENFEEIKFYQLAQLSVTVGMDIGMYRKTVTKGKPLNVIRDIMKQAPMADPDSPEVRRAWLGCYFISVQTSSALRRPVTVRWLPYMDECIEILENSPDALPSDKDMVQWAKLGRIIEEISSRFFADDMGSPSFSEPKLQFTLKAFEKQLEMWRKDLVNNHGPAILAQALAIVNIYLHESAMVLDPSNDEKKAADGDRDLYHPVAAARISALSSTLSSIHEAIDIICAIPVEELICMPTVALARTAFSIVALIKLYSIVSAPDSYIGQVIDPSALRVEFYMDKVIAHYKAAASLAGGITPGKFSTVMTMLREWFKSRKDQHEERGKTRDKDATSSATPQESNKSIPPGNTPLHLLSEVATGDPAQQQQYQGQGQPYLPSRTGHGFPLQTSPSDTSNSNTLPNLPPCVSPSQLPSNLHHSTSNSNPSPNPNVTSTTTYDQRTFYPPTNTTLQFDQPTTSPSTNPNTTSDSAPAQVQVYPNYTVSVPDTLSMNPNPTFSMNANIVDGMAMYAPDIGIGLDEQFLNSIGLGLGMGMGMGGETGMFDGTGPGTGPGPGPGPNGMWMSQGMWPF